MQEPEASTKGLIIYASNHKSFLFFAGLSLVSLSMMISDIWIQDDVLYIISAFSFVINVIFSGIANPRMRS